MKLIKRLLKWTARGLLVVFLLFIGSGVIAYWTSTNECDQKTTALVNPVSGLTRAIYS
jgi:predicted ribosomally synthesized peptide with SipW-like signal peptide